MGIDQEKNFFDNIVDSVIAVDKEGKIREVNPATLEPLGYKKKVLNLTTTIRSDKLLCHNQYLKKGYGMPAIGTFVAQASKQASKQAR